MTDKALNSGGGCIRAGRRSAILAEPRGTAPVWTVPWDCRTCAGQIRCAGYVRHEIVHNTYVVNDLKQKGAIFIEELADVPAGATLVFSAHGVSKAIQVEAERRGFLILTPRRVQGSVVEVAKLDKNARFIMIGHKGHQVEGTRPAPAQHPPWSKTWKT